MFYGLFFSFPRLKFQDRSLVKRAYRNGKSEIRGVLVLFPVGDFQCSLYIKMGGNHIGVKLMNGIVRQKEEPSLVPQSLLQLLCGIEGI